MLNGLLEVAQFKSVGKDRSTNEGAKATDGVTLIHSFIHSFISIAFLQVLYYSDALPTTARILYRSFTPKPTGNCG